jgi:hypothetical protein
MLNVDVPSSSFCRLLVQNFDIVSAMDQWLMDPKQRPFDRETAKQQKRIILVLFELALTLDMLPNVWHLAAWLHYAKSIITF